MNSDQTNSEEQKKKRPGLFLRIVTFPVRISFAARIAWLLFVFLVLLVTIAWLVFLLGPSHVPWRHSMTWSRILAVIGLTLIVPIIVYRALRLWLDGESSPFSDIDYAWKAGLVALEEHGLRIDSMPVFLVLGVSGPLQEKAIVEATGLSFRPS